MNTLPAAPGEDELARAHWFKSSRSNGATTCVEVAHLSDGTAVRDSTNPGGRVLFFTPGAWRRFLNTTR